MNDIEKEIKRQTQAVIETMIKKHNIKKMENIPTKELEEELARRKKIIKESA